MFGVLIIVSSLNVLAASLPPYGFGASENTIHLDMQGSNTLISQGDFLGTLRVHRLNKVINIYEGETMSNMDKGGGRFSFSGLNQGNTAIIGHNRGRTNGFFIFVKDLREGDLLTLKAGSITRTYAVSMVYTIDETDFNPLLQFSDNRLTLVTCVENVPSLRRIAVAIEVQ